MPLRAALYLGDGAAQPDRDEGAQLHHLDQQQPEAEAEGQRVEEMAESADNLGRNTLE